MQEKRITLSAEDNKLFVDEMLKGNEIIEEALTNWNDNPNDVEKLAYVYKALLDRDKECGGLIVSVESGKIPAGSENVKYFSGAEEIKVLKVSGSFDDEYLMVFTSRERFKECDETAGVVMFIRVAFRLLAKLEGIDGIVINIDNEEMILNKSYMEILNNMIKKGDAAWKTSDQ